MKGYLLAFIVLFICISSTFAQSETEPNNSFAQANSIPLNDTIQETISTNDDIDFFKITLPRDGVVDINISNLPCLSVFCSGGMPIEFKVYASDGTAIDSSSNLTGGGNSSPAVIYPVLLEKGTYYIGIYSSGNAFSSPNAFNTAFNFDSTDLNESNNQFSKAAAVPLNTIFKEKIYGNNKTDAYTKYGNKTGQDVDFYKITLPRDGVVEINITNLPCLNVLCNVGLPIEFKIYALDSTTIIDSSSNSIGGGNTAFDVNYPVLLEKGTYYVKVYGSGNAFSSPTAFNTAFNFDTTDLNESNNWFSKAATAPLNTVFKEKIYGNNKTGAYTNNGGNAGQDVDFYKITLSAKDTLRINVTNLPCLNVLCNNGLPIEVKIFALDSTTIIDSSSNSIGGGNTALEINYPVLLEEGSYYIKIYSSGNAFSSPTAFNTSFNTYSILLLKLVSFNAFAAGEENKIQWQAATEENASYFTIQRSSDGINFHEIGKVSASSGRTGVINYSFTDVNISSQNASAFYYRLQVVDGDGHFIYSSTIAVIMKSKPSINIYPNPVKNNLYIEVENDKAEKAPLQITDMQGRILKQQLCILQKGSVFFSVDISTLANGTYILFLKGEKAKQKLFIKQ